MIRNEKCEVLDKQNFEPKYRRVYDSFTFQMQRTTWKMKIIFKMNQTILFSAVFHKKFEELLFPKLKLA
jgi:hypothetical protein